MSVLSRPARSSRGAAAPAGTAAGIPAPRRARHDQDAAPDGQARPGRARRRPALVLAALVVTAAAVGTGVVMAQDSDQPSVLAPGVLHGSAEVDALRQEAAVRRQLSADAERAGEAQREAARAGG